MYLQLAALSKSLVALAGHAVFRTAPINGVLTKADIKIIRAMLSGEICSNSTLAVFLYGSDTSSTKTFRKRIERLCSRLAHAHQICEISTEFDQVDARTIQFYRNLTIGATLCKSADRVTARRFLLEALSDTLNPAVTWSVPRIHFMMAYEHATEGRGVMARASLVAANNAIREAIVVGEIQELWIELTIPIWKYADIPAHKERLLQARNMLMTVDESKPSVTVRIEATRLACAVAQHDRDLLLGLTWLNKLKSTLNEAGQSGSAELTEYHVQRLYLLRQFHLVDEGIKEARILMQVSRVGSHNWRKGASGLVKLLTENEQYADAFVIAEDVLASMRSFKYAQEFTLNITLRSAYARVLSGQSLLPLKRKLIEKHYPQDSIILHLLIAKRNGDYHDLEIAITSLRRHIERKKKGNTHPALVLLSKLLTTLDAHSYDLQKCRADKWFVQAEAKLESSVVDSKYSPLLPPGIIWKAITAVD